MFISDKEKSTCVAGVVREDCEDGSYFVEDSVGDLERIWREDIISDADDANSVIQVCAAYTVPVVTRGTLTCLSVCRREKQS